MLRDWQASHRQILRKRRGGTILRTIEEIAASRVARRRCGQLTDRHARSTRLDELENGKLAGIIEPSPVVSDDRDEHGATPWLPTCTPPPHLPVRRAGNVPCYGTRPCGTSLRIGRKYSRSLPTSRSAC